MCCIGAISFVSCSETEEVSTEFADWQKLNDEYFEASYQEGIANQATDPAHWKVIKACTKATNDEGQHTDYVIMQMVSTSSNTLTPEFTDSVRVHYRGYMKQSPSYTNVIFGKTVGLRFDTSYYGESLDPRTAVPMSFAVGGNNIVGFATALQHMHPGDRAIVTMPYQLGYKDKANGSIPAYSTLIFDITLVDIKKPGASKYTKE